MLLVIKSSQKRTKAGEHQAVITRKFGISFISGLDKLLVMWKKKNHNPTAEASAHVTHTDNTFQKVTRKYEH